MSRAKKLYLRFMIGFWKRIASVVKLHFPMFSVAGKETSGMRWVNELPHTLILS